MLPIGATTSPKGAMLALVVELLVTALIGAPWFLWQLHRGRAC